MKNLTDVFPSQNNIIFRKAICKLKKGDTIEQFLEYLLNTRYVFL